MKKLKSLTIFFPFYNDAGTVMESIDDAYKWGSVVAKDFEVIAIHGGASQDGTLLEIKKAKKKHRSLKVLDCSDNTEGYAVIKNGFKNARKEWVFYTDGDRQYHLDDLPRLVAVQRKTNADVVNGYKLSRQDGALRVMLGEGYRALVQSIFKSPVQDTTCDFRLIRTSLIKSVRLTSSNASVLIEMLKKLQKNGAVFAETYVNHYPRTYGTSSYTPMALLKERLIGDIKLYFLLKKSL